MRTITFAIIICLFVCTAGCGTADFPIHYFSFDNNELEIDGNHYRYSGGYARIGNEMKSAGSILAVYPSEQNPSPKIIVNKGKAEAFVFLNKEPVKVDINVIYFIAGDKIVCSKAMKESEFEYDNLSQSFSEENLQPILEKLIRENLPKEDMKTE